MHAAAFIIAAAAGLVAAQSTSVAVASVTSAAASTSTALSGCGSAVDAIISNCLTTENTQLLACPASDWDCMCTQITNVVTCYNNCPSDPAAVAATQQQTSYCNAAKEFGSSSSSATAKATATTAVAAAVSSTATTTTSVSGSTSASASASASSTPNAMAHLAAPAGGALVALMGFAALL